MPPTPLRPSGKPAKERAALRRLAPTLALVGPNDLNLQFLELGAIDRALEHSDGNRTRAARLLGISVRTLQRKLKRRGWR